jgi:hypothetical protein
MGMIESDRSRTGNEWLGAHIMPFIRKEIDIRTLTREFVNVHPAALRLIDQR